MKKIICILMSLVIIGSASFAQDKSGKKTTANTQSGEAKKTATPKPNSVAAKGQSNARTDAGKPVAQTKKDGTPDMRTKANKQAAQPATKLKKDGTPDMRYKANKNATNNK